MIITGLEVSGIGRFREPVRLTGFGPGVNVLAASNEAGKSTLYRAVRACFFERHTAGHDDIRRLASSEAALPAKVKVAFSHRGRDYEIAKSFLRSAHACLRRDGGEIAIKSTADEMLWELLGLKPGSGRLKDEAAFGLLWVGQRRSFHLDDMSAGAANLFSDVVSAEVGGLVGGDRARSVLAKVKAALRLDLTEGGKPRAGGPLRAALDAHEGLLAREAALKQRLESLEQDFRALARARADLGRLYNPAERGRLEADLKAAQVDEAAAKAAVDVLARLDLQAQAQEGRAGVVAEKLKHLEDVDGRIRASRARIESLTQEISAVEAANAAARTSLNEAAAAVTALENEASRLAGRSERLHRLERAIEAADRRREWRGRLDQARAIVSRLRGIEQEIGALRVTDKTVAEANRLHDEVTKLQARRDASAPRLAVTLGPYAGSEVRLDGRVLAQDEGLVLRDAATVTVGGIVTLKVVPSMSSASEMVALAEAEHRLATALARAGAGSVLEAREALARGERLRRDREALLGQLAVAAPKGSRGEDGLAHLEERIAQATGVIAAALLEAGTAEAAGVELPTPAALAAEREAVRAEEASLAPRRADAGTALETAQRLAHAQTNALGSLNGRRADEAERLTLDLKGAPDDSRAGDLGRLAEDLEAARERARQAGAAAALQRISAPSEDEMKRRSLKVERLLEAFVNHDRRRADLEKEIFALETGIAAAGGDGLEEEFASVTANREIAEAKVARLTEEVEALRLLEREIEDSLAQSRERFLAPVKQHLRPFLADVLPMADLHLGEDFKPLSLVREAAPEGFDLLSDGTREQIAVLVRLALGAMLATKGEPVPIILDDALVFSDDERVERMFDALARAAKNQQVIVLTCRTRAFAPLGGHVLRVEPVAA